MANKHQENLSVDDYLKDGWIPIAETRMGITYEKTGSSTSIGTVFAGVVILLWALFTATYSLGLTLGIAINGLLLLAIFENTRAPQRMLILHEHKDAG